VLDLALRDRFSQPGSSAFTLNVDGLDNRSSARICFVQSRTNTINNYHHNFTHWTQGKTPHTKPIPAHPADRSNRTDHHRCPDPKFCQKKSQENSAKSARESQTPPQRPTVLNLTVTTLSSTNTTLAGVAQSVERVALITAKRSTSRSWVRAPPSAIPIISSSSEQLFFCSFGGILIGGVWRSDCMFLESRRAVVGVVASRCELSRFLGPGRKEFD
jgi:hypothetical protein